MDRNDKSRLIYRAEKLELASKGKGQRNGVLGATGLAILRLLIFRYGDSPSPSYRTLRRHSGLCFNTISICLKRLAEAGLIQIERRTRWTMLGNRQITNLYRLILVSRETQESYRKVSLERAKTGPYVTWAEWQSPLKVALEKLAGRLGASMPTG